MKTANDQIYYFDYASATPPSNSILDEFMQNQKRTWANSSSLHSLGRYIDEQIEIQKQKLSQILSIKHHYIHFFPSATISNNIAIFDIVNRVSKLKKKIYYSSLEHPSILIPLSFWAELMQVRLEPIPLYNNQLDLSVIKNDLGQIGAIVISSNTSGSGVLHNLHDIKHLIQGSNILWHCDISSLAYVRMDNLGNLGPSHITLTAKKIYGLDIAVLITSHLKYPLIKSSNDFAGTPNYALICSLTQALEEMVPRYSRVEYLASLRDQFETKIMNNVDIDIVGKKLPRLPNYSFLWSDIFNSDHIIYQISKKGIMIGANTSCQAKIERLDQNLHTLRITFGYENTASQVDYLSQNLISVINSKA